MKHTSFLRLSFALLAVMVLSLSSHTSAHPTTVDGTSAEWTNFGAIPIEKQVGHIIRNAAGQGEYSWRDALGDARLVPGESAANEIDLRQLRVTGTASGLSVYAQFAKISASSGAQAVQLQLALRTDFSSTNGNTNFVAPVGAQPVIGAQGAWQYLLKTNFATAQANATGTTTLAQPLRYTSPSDNGTPVGAASLSKANNGIEMTIPWTALGSNEPLPRVRFTAAVLRSNGAAPNDGSAAGAVRDVVSPLATSDELADGSLDYAFDVYFNPTFGPTQGEVVSPLLITEIAPLPRSGTNTTDSKSQWLEVTNTSASTMAADDVAQFKVGDASNRDSTEGMFRLPRVSLIPGQSLVIARQRNSFATRYPVASFPGVNYGSGNPNAGGNVYGMYNDGSTNGAINLLTPYTPQGWLANTSPEADGSFQLPARPLTGASTYTDQLVLLDSQDTLADVVQYASPGVTAIYPGHTPLVAPAGGFAPDTDYQRCPASRDTNNGPVDFALTTVKAQQTPGTTYIFPDLYVSTTGPSNVVVGAFQPTVQTFVVGYGNQRNPTTSATITVTLPLGMSYRPDLSASTPGLNAPTSSTTNGRTQLVWAIGTPLLTDATGLITLTTELPAATALVTTSLDAAISGAPKQAEPEQANNVASLPIAYVAEPTADLAIAKHVADDSQLYPDGYIVYRVDVSNPGTKDAESVVLDDTVPAGLRYFSNSAGLAATPSSSSVVSFDLGTVAAGVVRAPLLITFTVDMATTVGTTVQNKASVSTITVPELPTTNNSATSEISTVGLKPDVANVTLTKRISDASKLYPGGNIVYRLDFSNAGTLDADDVAIVDDVPGWLSYSSNSLDLAAELLPRGRVRLDLGALPAQSTAASVLVTFSVAADAPVGTSVTNSATIITSSPEAPITNNNATSETATIGVAPAPDLAVSVEVTDAPNLSPLGEIVYTIAYSNTGSQPAADVTLESVMPAGLSYVSNSGGLVASQSAAGVVRWSLGSLSAGAHGSFTVTYRIQSNAAVGTSVVNQVTIATSTAEPNTANNVARSTALVIGSHRLLLPIIIH